MKSGGSGSTKAPAYATPNIHAVADANGVTPFGQASVFNPQYTSFLPTNGAVAQLGDKSRLEGGPAVPLQAQQEAEIERQKQVAAAADSGAGAAANKSRAALATLLAGNGRDRINSFAMFGGDSRAGGHH